MNLDGAGEVSSLWFTSRLVSLIRYSIIPQLPLVVTNPKSTQSMHAKHRSNYTKVK